MNLPTLTEDRLAELIDRFSAMRIAVIGDFFLDRYLDVDPALEELSIETGKPAHQVAGIRCSPGAAGTVVSNLAALGAGELHAIGYTGIDGESFELRNALSRIGCTTSELHSTEKRFTPTYLKPRDRTRPGLEGEHSRYDTKNRRPTPELIQQKIVESLTRLLPDVDAVIVMDQVENDECGCLTAAVRKHVCDLATSNADVIFWADSRRRIRQFHHVIAKPNQYEVLGIDNPVPDQQVDRARLLKEIAAFRTRNQAPLFVTRGADGMIITDPEPTLVPGFRTTKQTDPTGAGDSATAGCVLALGSGATDFEAAVCGNLVASITVEQLATTGTASPEMLAPRLALWREQNATD